MSYLYNNRHQVSRDDNQNSINNPIWTSDTRDVYTPKNRLKVSDIETRWFNTFQGNIGNTIWDTFVTNNGAATLDTNANMVNMEVTGQAGSEVIRQTKQVMGYIPSRPSEVSFATVFGTQVAGVRRRVGMFDQNNGMYLEDDGTTYNVVIRSSTSGSVVENRIPRDQWLDPLDGTGASGINIDATKVQLVTIRYEWYGAGHVEFLVTYNDQQYRFHDFTHANVIDGPWCATPFLPLRYEITNITGAAGTPNHVFKQLSSSHTKEGTSRDLGQLFNYATPITGKSLAAAQTWYPMVSIRMKSTRLNSYVLPAFFQAATQDSVFLNYRLYLNGTLTGANWTDHPNADSAMQYDTAATAITGGTVVNSGFIPAGAGGTQIVLGDNAIYQLGRTSLGTASDTLTLAVALSAGTNKTGHGMLGWIEQR